MENYVHNHKEVDNKWVGPNHGKMSIRKIINKNVTKLIIPKRFPSFL